MMEVMYDGGARVRLIAEHDHLPHTSRVATSLNQLLIPYLPAA